MKYLILFSIVFFLTATAAAQQGWVKLTSGTTAGLSHISLVGPDTVYVSGDTLLRSTDAGATWEGLIGAPAGSGVLDFRNDTTGFLVSNGIVYKTTNGGLTWANVGGGYVGTIQFIGADTGWAFGQGFLARTTDNGNTWQNFGQTIAGYDATCISFADATHGYMMGIARPWPPNPSISAAEWFKTADGGKTWEPGYAAPSQDVNGKRHSGVPNNVRSIIAFNADTVMAVGDYGLIAITKDGAADWDTVLCPTNEHLNGVSFPDRLHGSAVGSNGAIIHTTDAGFTWSLQNSGITDGSYLYAVKFVDTLIGYAVGDAGIILKTMDGGFSWVRISPLSSNFIQGTVYPQPSSMGASVEYNLPQVQHVSLSVQNVTGATVENVISGSLQSPGVQSVKVNTTDLASGAYTYVLQTEKYYSTGKIEVIH